MKVEANYRGKGKFIKGVIRKVRLDGTFDVEYDDGDRESGIREADIRPFDGGGRDFDDRSGFRRSGGISRSPVRRRSVSPRRKGSPSPRRKGSRSPPRRDSRSPRGLRSLRDRDEDDAPRRKSFAKVDFSFLNKLRKLCSKYQVLDETCYSRFAASDETVLTGSVSKKDFKAILRSFHSATRSSRDEGFEDAVDGGPLEDMMACLSDSGDGSVNYQHFLAYMFDRDDGEDLERVRESLARDVVKKKYSRNEISKLFESAKTFTKGYVRPSELEKVVKKLSPKLSSKDAADVAVRFDLNKEGAADFNLFIDWMLFESSFEVVAQRVTRQLGALDEKEVESMLEKYAERGSLRSGDFYSAMQQSGFVLVSSELHTLFEQMEKDTRGRLTSSSVMDYLKDLAQVKKTKKKGRQGILPDAMMEDVGKAIDSYLRESRCTLGFLLNDISESSGGLVSDRQLRRLMEKLEVRDYDELQEVLFECFGKDGKSRGVPADSVLLFLMDCFERIALAEGKLGVDGLVAVKEAVTKKCKKGKDIIKVMQPFEGRVKGSIDHRDFEDALKKLCGSGITRDQVLDVKSLLDPNTNGKMDYYWFAAVVQCFLDPSPSETGLKNLLRLFEDKRVDYRDTLLGDKSNAMPVQDLVGAMRSLGSPIAFPQLFAVSYPFTRRNKVDVDQLLSNLKKRRFDASMLLPGRKASAHASEEESFGKGLHQKICKARSNAAKKTSLRNGLLQADEDISGGLSKRELLRCVETSLELSEEESELLVENLTADSSSTLDYLHLLLLLAEPFPEAVVECGTKVISKMLRAGDLVGLRRLCSVLLRKCASYDRKRTGCLGVEFITTILREECFNLDDKILKQLTKAFLDKDTGGVLYLEMVALLRCCFNGYVLKRMQYFLLIRKRQGYNVRDFMTKYAQTKGKKLDQSKLSEQLISLGIFMSDTAISLLFMLYKDRHHSGLDVARLFDAVEQFEEGAGGAGGDGSGPASILKADIAPLKLKSVNADGQPICEIAQQLLEEYDKKLVRAMHAAFHLFDQSNTGEVAAVELERILGSVGYFVSFDELQDLVVKIDRHNKGLLQYNDFIANAIPFVRQRYELASQLSAEKLHKIFKKFDTSGDGLLQRSELKLMLQLSSKHVSKEEVDALMSLLDVDQDGDISWDEFRRVFTMVSDAEYMGTLPYNSRSALRKLQYSGLPDPEEYLTMFVGLPFNYRLSVLSDLEKSGNYHALQKEVCGAVPLMVDEHDPAMQFEVQVVRVSGVPSEESFRRNDIVNRSVKFSICQTDQPPASGQPGHPPVFLSNVMKCNASLHPQYLDKWIVSNKEDLDPDKSCFVRCYAKDWYYADGAERAKPDGHTTPNDQLYLFVELITTFRVSKAFRLTNEGLKFKGRMKDAEWNAPNQTIMDKLLRRSMQATAQEQQSKPKASATSTTNASGQGVGVSQEKDVSREANRGDAGAAGNRNSMSKSLSFFPKFFRSKPEEDSESDDGRPRARADHRDHLRRSRSRSKGRSSSSPSKRSRRRRQDSWSDREDGDSDDDGRDRAGSRRLRRRERDGDDSSRSRSRGRGESENRRRRRSDRNDSSEFKGSDSEDSVSDEGDDLEGQKSKLVEMCCGWAMIPIAATLRGNARKFKVEMCGGTPFDLVAIMKDEVVRRPGAWQSIKRAFGFNVKSVLEIVITPAVPSYSLRNMSRALSAPTSNSPIPVSAANSVSGGSGQTGASAGAGRASATSSTPTALAAAPDGLPWLTKLLPVNIVLPTSSVTVVGIYRKILADTLRFFEDQPERILPQTGSLHHADPLLSSFPRVLADPAACRALLMLWKKEFPMELNGKTYRDMTIQDASSVRALQVFRSVVLRLWHAFSSPEAQPGKLQPFESEEDIIARELRIRELLGIGVGKNPQLSLTTQLAKSISTNTGAAASTGGTAVARPESLNLSRNTPPAVRSSTNGFSFLQRKAEPQGSLVGAVVVNGVTGTAPQALTNPATALSAAKEYAGDEHLYTPFNARELMWTKPVLDR